MTKKQVIFLKVVAVMAALFTLIATFSALYFWDRAFSDTGTYLHLLGFGLMVWSATGNYEFLQNIGHAIEHNDIKRLHK